MTNARIIPEHIDVTGEIDKELGRIEAAESKMSILQRVYGVNVAVAWTYSKYFHNFFKNLKKYFFVKCPIRKKVNNDVEIWAIGGHFRGQIGHFMVKITI